MRALLIVLPLAVFVSVVWFLQTPAGFAAIVPPLAARAGLEVEAELGRITWLGALRLEGARIRRGESLDISIEHLALDLGVASLLPWRRIELESVDARGIRVSIVADDAETAGVGEPPPILPILPVVRPHFSVTDVELRWTRADEFLELGPVDARFACGDEGCPIQARVPFRNAAGAGALTIEGLAELDGARGWSWAATAELGDKATGRFVADLVGGARDEAIDLAPSSWTLAVDGLDANGTLSGRLESDTRRSKLALVLASARVARERIPHELRTALGESAARGDLRFEVENERFTLMSELELAPFVLEGPAPRALRCAAEIRLRSGSPIELASFVSELVSDGEDFGRIEAQGRARDERGITFRLEEFSLAPWLVASGAVLNEEDRAIRLSGEGALRLPEAGASGTLQLALVGAAAGELRLSANAELTDARWSLDASLDGPGAAAARANATHTPDQGIRSELLLADWDLTPWSWLWERPGASPGQDAPRATDTGPGPDLRARLEAERVRLGALEVARAELEFGREGEVTTMALSPSELLGGTAEWAYEERVHGGARTVSWSGRGSGLDFASIWSSLGVVSGVVSGRFAFETEGHGAGPDPLAHADGSFSFTLDDGAAEGTRLQSQVVAALDMIEYSVLTVERADGDWEIVDGTMYADELRIGSDVLHLMLTGEITRTGMSLSANPRLGPGYATGGERRFRSALLGSADGALALPIVATLEGPWDALEAGVLPAPPSTLNSLYRGLADLAVEAGEAAGMQPSEGP